MADNIKDLLGLGGNGGGIMQPGKIDLGGLFGNSGANNQTIPQNSFNNLNENDFPQFSKGNRDNTNQAGGISNNNVKKDHGHFQSDEFPSLDETIQK